jgi:hypothetical protein
MRHDSINTGGFDPPSPHRQTAQERTKLSCIAIVALAVSTVVAVTVVSIGIARAEMFGVAASGDGRVAVALFLATIFAGMGGLAAVTVLYNRRRPRQD